MSNLGGGNTKFADGNKIGDIPDTSAFIDELFRGVEADGADVSGELTEDEFASVNTRGRKQTSSYKEWCEDREGSVRGAGPNCEPEEETARRDVAKCFFFRSLECIVELRNKIETGSAGPQFNEASEEEPPAAVGDQGSPGGPSDSQQGGPGGGSGGGGPKPPEAEPEQPPPGGARACCDQYIEAVANSTDVEPAKACYREAYEQYNTCIKAIPAACECKNCTWDVRGPDDGDDGAEEPIDEDTDAVDPFKRREFNTQSAHAIIPKLYGRYIVPGNIIWVGNKQTEAISYTRTLDGGELTTINDNVTTIDLMVAVAAGTQEAVLRIWFAEALVYNASLEVGEAGDALLSAGDNGSIDLNLSVLAPSDYDMERLAAFRPTVEFLDGSAAQQVWETLATSEGFGRVPAHRGLSIVCFRDVDLRLFGTQFPEMRFDMTSKIDETVVPYIDGALQDAEPAELEVDLRTELVYTRDGDDLILRDLNTLDVSYTATIVDLEAFLVFKSGQVLAHDGIDLLAYDPFAGRVITNLGAGIAPGPGSLTFQALDAIRIPYQYAVSADTDGAFDLVLFDHNLDTAEIADSFAGLTGYTLQDACLTTFEDQTYLFQFLLADDFSDMKVRRYLMLNGNERLADPNTLVTFTVPATVWRSAADVTARVLQDTTDNSFVLFFTIDAANPQIVKLASADLAVVWTTEVLVNLTGSLFARGMRSLLASPYHYLVDANNDMVRLTLATGVVEVVDNVIDQGRAGVSGAQYYDSRTNSVLYLSDPSERLIRVFQDKIVPAQISIGEIVQDLIKATTLDPDLLDVSDVLDVLFDGYLIDRKITLQGVIDELGELYQVAVIDSGRRLALVKEQSLGTVVPLDLNDILVSTLETTTDVVGSDLDTATAQFVNIGIAGLIEITQTVSLKPDDERELIPQDVNFNLNLNDDPLNVRINLEKVLRTRLADFDKARAQLMPRLLRLTPRDRVEIDGKVYRVRGTYTGPGLHQTLEATAYDPDVETDIEIAEVINNNNVSVIKPGRQPPYRPVVLFTNAVNDEAAGLSLVGQVVLTGLETPDRTVDQPRRFNMRVWRAEYETPNTTVPNFDGITTFTFGSTSPSTNQNSPAYQTELHTEGLHTGLLVTPPVDRTWDQFQTDVDSAMVVRFTHADTLTKFVTQAGLNPWEVLQTPTHNLLFVGREHIQFTDWTVDMDGLTVTFSGLFRGKNGTDPYINGHVADERVYLYTPESMKPMAIDPAYTRLQQVAKLYYGTGTFAGVPNVTWGGRTDSGAARPWAPTNLRRFDSGFVFLGARHRRALLTDFETTGGPIPDDWLEFADGSVGNYAVMVLQYIPTPEEFEERFVRSFDLTALEVDLVESLNFVDSMEFVAQLQLIGTNPLTDPLHVCLVELNKDVVGHPAFRTFDPGSYPPIP